MKVKAVIIDFDGTIVDKDVLDIVCGITGKQEESEKINAEFHDGKRLGLGGLIERINFLSGVSTAQIIAKLSEDAFLVKGVEDFFDFLNKKGIISVLSSGNLVPILKYYQEKLNISYIVGTQPKMKEDIIDSISEEDFPGRAFKLTGSISILDQLGIKKEEVIAIGDSIADKGLFDFAEKAIAINAKGGIEEFADFQINQDFSEAIEIIKNL